MTVLSLRKALLLSLIFGIVSGICFGFGFGLLITKAVGVTTQAQANQNQSLANQSQSKLNLQDFVYTLRQPNIRYNKKG